MLREVTASYGNVRVDSFRGLLVDFCRDQQAAVVVKGLRAVSDFDYELQMAQMNIGLAGVETLFMPTNPRIRSSRRAWSRRWRSGAVTCPRTSPTWSASV